MRKQRLGSKFLFLGALLASLTTSACTSDSRIATVDAGSHLVVVASRDDAIEEIEPNGGRVRDHSETRGSPERVAVSRDGRFAVATDYGDKTAGRTLSVYDLVERRPEPTIDLAPYSRPFDVAFIDRRSTVYVTIESSNVVLEVALRGGRILRAIPTGGEAPRALLVSPDKRRAFVANSRSGSVAAIDVPRGVVTANIEVGRNPSGMCWVAGRAVEAARAEVTQRSLAAEIWIALADGDTILVLDAATLAIERRIACTGSPVDLAASPDGMHVAVALARTDEIALFAASEYREVARLPARRALDFAANSAEGPHLDPAGRSGPTRVLIDPESRFAFVSLRAADCVAVIDLAAREFTGVYTTGRSPAGLAWSFRRESPAFLSDGPDK